MFFTFTPTGLLGYTLLVLLAGVLLHRRWVRRERARRGW